jgi:predicted HicB family RNase H-like nuclease
MAKPEEPWVQLATRIPKELHRRLKLHCVTHDAMLQQFVTEAVREKLGRKPRLCEVAAQVAIAPADLG